MPRRRTIRSPSFDRCVVPPRHTLVHLRRVRSVEVGEVSSVLMGNGQNELPSVAKLPTVVYVFFAPSSLFRKDQKSNDRVKFDDPSAAPLKDCNSLFLRCSLHNVSQILWGRAIEHNTIYQKNMRNWNLHDCFQSLYPYDFLLVPFFLALAFTLALALALGFLGWKTNCRTFTEPALWHHEVKP